MSLLQLKSDETIYYELIEGKSDAPYLIFLHEGLGCISMWKDFPGRLCRQTGCPGLLYDRIGYGRSSPLRFKRTIHYLHDYALYELPQIIQAVIPNREFVLIGHSDGGSISLILGSERPSLLRGIVTEAAHVFVDSKTIAGLRAAEKGVKRGQFKGLYKYHQKKTDQVFKAWLKTWLSDWFQSWNIEYLLPSIRCPLLVIQGMADQYGSEEQVYSIVSKSSGPAYPFMVENCGHIPHLEQPERLISRISGFIESIA